MMYTYRFNYTAVYLSTYNKPNLYQPKPNIKVHIKGGVCDSNPIHIYFPNSANISSRSASCSFCVCGEKMLVHSPAL